MPITDLSGGTLKVDSLSREIAGWEQRRMSTGIFVFSSSPFPSMCSWPLSRSGWKSMSVSTQLYRQIRWNQNITDDAYNPDERYHNNQLNLFN